mmetsp:Transcript_22604/g.47167  ORF Transcript_22604/g.47167 Transcript_22604/m.47167 type:complete len:86 (+) Transcript_22604:1318-1575(+)
MMISLMVYSRKWALFSCFLLHATHYTHNHAETCLHSADSNHSNAITSDIPISRHIHYNNYGSRASLMLRDSARIEKGVSGSFKVI